jgi:single-stranded DNA-binding protein
VVNTVSFTGHLTNDPVRRDTAKGVVAVFRLAVDDRPERLWIDVESWGHLAGIVATHLARRRHVAVTGRLRDRPYHDHDAQQRHHVYVVADRVTFLDRPAEVPANGDVDEPAVAR